MWIRPLHIFIVLSFLSVTQVSHSQDSKKAANAYRTYHPVEIDGILKEKDWEKEQKITGFVQHEPYAGRPASQPSVVKILYDNNSLYVGAILYDSSPDSIYREFGERDEISNTDWFGIYIDPFDDGLISYGFFVTASGVQIDEKLVSGDDDKRWDAVWDSHVQITDSGWIAEIEIPYSAIRFQKDTMQIWGINCFRSIRRYRELSTWNFINPKIESIGIQHGELKGIENIKPPVRLAFIPYVSGYLEKSPLHSKWGHSFKAGLDIKYGISESFTLDMILIPDFGQVESDEEVFNLSPFEIYYSEKRPFFMEGTELFDKGDVFYSRRIGDTPDGYNSLEDSLMPQEQIYKNPDINQLINATKITGKTKNGLATGFFNAMTSNTYAVIRDTITGLHRDILTDRFTNYNMIVLEQSLKNNSFISLFNTNVYTPGAKYVANVTGSDFRFQNRSNMFGVNGEISVSQKYNKGFTPDFGYQYEISAGKIGGNFTFDLEYKVNSDTYDPNDMGFQQRNNYTQLELDLNYNTFEPSWHFINTHNSLEISYETLHTPHSYAELWMEYSSRVTLKNYLTLGLNLYSNPYETHDYYEPRIDGWMLVRPPGYGIRAFVSPDYRKKFVIDLSTSFSQAPQNNNYEYGLGITPRLRVNDRLFFSNRFEYNFEDNEIGYVTDSSFNNNEIIIIGQRDVTEIENTLNARYIFNEVSSISVKFRYYWLKAIHSNFYDLQPDGFLVDNDYTGSEDFDYNALTVDLGYNWYFLPGSQISVVWKNSIFVYNEEKINQNYFEGIRNTIESPSTNSFSVKILFYIDYLYLKRKNFKS